MTSSLRVSAYLRAPLHDGPAKQSGGFDDQYGDNQRQRDRQFQFIADAGDIGSDEIFEDADQEASDHRTERTGQPAEHGGADSGNEAAARIARPIRVNRKKKKSRRSNISVTPIMPA